MMIKYNLNTYEPVPMGERVLQITDAKCVPSGKPQKLEITYKDVETGRTLKSSYSFNIPGALMAMGFLCKTVLKMEDSGEFDTINDTPKLVGKKILAVIKHVEGTTEREDGTLPVFANIEKVISLIENTNINVNINDLDVTVSGRSTIQVGDDLD